MPDPIVRPIERMSFSHAPWTWPFAHSRRDDIAAHFETLRRRTPMLWNGRVFLMNECRMEGASVEGRFFETGYADFIAWRDWGFPDRAIVNGFSMGAIRSSDGAYLLGVMAQSTANAGRIYFPSGTPDRSDVLGETMDLAGSVLREVTEETGLLPSDFHDTSRWTAVRTGVSLAMMRELHSHERAEALRARIMDFLARQKTPELADIRIVRSVSDFDPQMPDFVTAFLSRALAA